MRKIAELMNSPEHYRMSNYVLEYRLYGVPDCEIFAGIGRSERKPHIFFSEYNISDEVLRWDDYPMLTQVILIITCPQKKPMII